MTTIFEELDPWIRQDIFERFYCPERWHVIILQNHKSTRPNAAYWDKMFDEFFNLWEAQQWAEEKYPGVPVRFVRVVWEPHIQEIRR